MIRNPAAGDRVLAPGWPTKHPATVVEVRQRGKALRCLVEQDDGRQRLLAAVELEPEELSDRARDRARGLKR